MNYHSAKCERQEDELELLHDKGRMHKSQSASKPSKTRTEK